MGFKYFTPASDPMIDFDKIDMQALEMLENAREFAQTPFIISSSYRTPEHCIEIGSKPDSAHTDIPCSAFDILAGDAHTQLLIIRGLLQAGFNRIGLNLKNSHIHVDASPNKPKEVFFIE